MPSPTLDAARAILAEDPTQQIMLCTGLVDDSVEQAAKELGIRATLLKTAIGTLPGLIGP